MTTAPAPGAVRAVPVQPSYVRQRASSLIRHGGDTRVLLLRAQPTWPDEPVLTVDGRRVRVALGISQLAVLDALSTLEDDEYLVVLTDRSDEDLGDAVRVVAWQHGVERIDEWATVPALFPGARETSSELRRRGDWVATALLDLVPAGGWPPSPSLVVDSSLALGTLLAHLLQQPAGATLDGSAVMRALGGADVRSRWLAADADLRKHLVGWAEEALGRDVAFALHVASSGTSVAPLAVALAADVLWPDLPVPVAPAEQQVAARTRLEAFAGRRPVDPLVAQAAARTARADVERMVVVEAADLAVVRGQAEALLADLGWPEGAQTSSVLRAGLVARVRALSAALTGADGEAVEARLRAVTDHGGARTDDSDVYAARMAVRLSRWLATPEPPAAAGLGAALRQQVDDGAWTDRAVTALWKGSGDPQVSAVYEALMERARQRRRRRDEAAAQHLAAATAAGQDAEGATAVEDLLADVVVPLAAPSSGGVLLVVLDGMSSAVATDVAQAALDLGMVELVPAATGRRQPALAVLPTLTKVSRTSLLTGALGTGAMAEEKSGFARATQGVLFHKDDLRPEGGARLADRVRRAVADEQTRVVGVVINTVDDALHKTDTSTTRWTLDALTPLRELLDAASLAGRTVVLTSDHGHVLERGSTGRSVPGAQARWRPAGSGPVSDGEVLIRGPRVVTPGGEAVLLWREDVRHGGVQTGYHGGVSLAEMTVPVIVLRRRETSRDRVDLPGWQTAAPQSPPWWNDPVGVAAPEAVVPEPSSRRRRPSAAASARGPAGEDSLFDVPAPPPAAPEPTPTGDLVDELLASEVYAQQRRRAGRRAVADDVVAAVLRALLQRGGRAHSETVAAAAAIPTPSVATTLAALRRLVNVEGYEVLEMERDRVTVRLDRDLLVEQFELSGGGRG